MFLISFANILPRLASMAAFLCLVVAHLEWPLMAVPPFVLTRVPWRPGAHPRRPPEGRRDGSDDGTGRDPNRAPPASSRSPASTDQSRRGATSLVGRPGHRCDVTAVARRAGRSYRLSSVAQLRRSRVSTDVVVRERTYSW